MKRVACVLAVLAALCVVAGQAQAYGPYYHNGHHNSYYHGGYHHGYYGSVVVPRVYVTPQVVFPAVMPTPTAICPQPLFYRPAYVYPSYPYYAPAPAAGFYYRSRGLSLGVGW
jgi:hypothetical protein